MTNNTQKLNSVDKKVAADFNTIKELQRVGLQNGKNYFDLSDADGIVESLRTGHSRVRQAALDGTTGVLGSGLKETIFMPGLLVEGQYGNMFISAGVKTEKVQGNAVSYKSFNYGNGSGYVKRTHAAFANQSLATRTINDVTGTIYTDVALMEDYIAEMAISEVLEQGQLSDPYAIIRAFEYALEAKQTILHDEVVLSKLIADGTGYAPGADIGETLYKLHAQLRLKNQSNVAFFMNLTTYNRFILKVGTDGHYKFANTVTTIGPDVVLMKDVDGTNRQFGHVANFQGRPIYVVNDSDAGYAGGFTNTFAVTSNQVTSTTSGAQSLIVACNPMNVKLGVGMNSSKRFNKENDLNSFRAGTDMVIRDVYLGVALASENTAVYSIAN